MGRHMDRDTDLIVNRIKHRPFWTNEWVRDGLIGTGIFSVIWVVFQLIGG